jgi:hypothetical protein
MELSKEKCYITTYVVKFIEGGIALKYEYKFNANDKLEIEVATKEPHSENPTIKFLQIKFYRNSFKYFENKYFENIPDKNRAYFLDEDTFTFSYDFFVDLKPNVLHETITNFFYKKGVSHDIIDKIWCDITDKETVEIIHKDVCKNTEEIVYKVHAQFLLMCKSNVTV